MHRFSVPTSQSDTVTLDHILSDLDPEAHMQCISQEPNSNQRPQQPLDRHQPIAELKLKHGSLIQLVSPTTETRTDSSSSIPSFFDPYPQLSKRKRRATRSSYSSLNSLTRLDELRSQTMHVLSTMKLSQIRKLSSVHVCPNAAQRFLQFVTKNNNVKTRLPFAILLGTTTQTTNNTKITTQDKNHKKESVQIHAIWIPPPSIQENILSHLWNPAIHHPQCPPEYHQMVHLASQLGLSIVGWIYAYDSTSLPDISTVPLPFQGSFIQYAAWGQIYSMKHGSKDVFITLAMERNTGTTEAFQLHDILVQMFAEDVFILEGEEKEEVPVDESHPNGHGLSTKIPVIVDGLETQHVDPIVATIHTPMFSTPGHFTSSHRVLPKLDIEQEDSIWLSHLCDFQTLVELDKRLSKGEMNSLCNVLKEFTKNRTGVLGTGFKLVLQNIWMSRK